MDRGLSFTFIAPRFISARRGVSTIYNPQAINPRSNKHSRRQFFNLNFVRMRTWTSGVYVFKDITVLPAGYRLKQKINCFTHLDKRLLGRVRRLDIGC